MPAPQLTIINGRPGTGKTTLAQVLATRLHCPLLSRDQLKEGLVYSTDRGFAAPTNANLYILDVFRETVSALLKQGISLVVEAAWQHRIWAKLLPQLQCQADIRIVYLTVSTEIATQRRIDRARRNPEFIRFHADAVAEAFVKDGTILETGPHQRPEFDIPLLEVDTTDGYEPNVEAMLDFLKS